MEVAIQIGLKAKKKMHKNPGNRDYYKYMAFLIILETAYGSQFWSVPSQF